MKKKKASQGQARSSADMVTIRNVSYPSLQQAIWRRNRVKQLPEGISLVPGGRSGHLYDRRGDRFIDIDVEMSGTAALELVVYMPETPHWVHVDTFECTPLSTKEQASQLQKFRTYLDQRKLRYRHTSRV